MHRLRIPMLVLTAAALAACTGVETSNLQPLTSEDVAEPAAASASLMPQPAAQLAFPATNASAALPPGPIATSAVVQFAPVMGAAPEVLPSLSLRLAARAGQRGVPLTQGGSATHLMRGYFSAFTENRETTIIYVWDVTDPSGNRLHRIQGQHRLPAGSQQGWQSVTPAMMEAIADRTIDDLAAWLAARAG